MAAQQTANCGLRQSSSHSARTGRRNFVMATTLLTPVTPRKSVALEDPEDVDLLREKLNQIAVGRTHAASRGDNQMDHLDRHSSDDDDDSEATRGGGVRRRRPLGQNPFGGFLGSSDRPSTPPSSPQPRDVLRKQLRMKNHAMCPAPRHSMTADDNNSDTASDEPFDGMCVDSIEISPISLDDELLPGSDHVTTVRLSVPEHLRAKASFSVLSKCPEGFRKRKSMHMDESTPEMDDCSTPTPLKRVSSEANMAPGACVSSSSTASATTTWDRRRRDSSTDQDME
ncbi:hypothetical protein PINS_up005084 [Pythium insidiosum]|nr:hypothetical protein PINS_up005084 [Pythium insidiosum]